MVLETKVISKTFRKPHRVPLMPDVDDDLGNHLIKKWYTRSSCVSTISKMDWFKLRPLLQPDMRNHSTLIWERALLITQYVLTWMPALLVTGVICGHSRDGVVPGRAAMTVFTGHRTHCWYPVLVISDEYGSEAPQKEFIL